MSISDICPLCGRPYGGVMQDHHLKPVTFRSRTKEVHSTKVRLHKMCHQKIHATFAEKDLFHYYHTIEHLLEHEEMQKFVKWISKKDPDFYDKNDDTKQRKKKRGS